MTWQAQLHHVQAALETFTALNSHELYCTTSMSKPLFFCEHYFTVVYNTKVDYTVLHNKGQQLVLNLRVAIDFRLQLGSDAMVGSGCVGLLPASCFLRYTASAKE